jgi:site-specific recombinase XerD
MRVELPVYMTAYLDHLTSTGKIATMKQYRSGLRVFVGWFKDYNETYDVSQSFTNLTNDDYLVFVEWLERKQYSHATMNRIATTITNLQLFLGVPVRVKVRELINTSKTFPLKKDDFITDLEFKKLIWSFTQGSGALNYARSILSNRNLSLILLMRHYGLTPAQLSGINMEDINLAQNELVIYFKHGQKKILQLQQSIKNTIYAYLHDIDEKVRPRYHTKDPLFVAYNNSSKSFQFNYDGEERPEPKRIAERSIMKILNVEVSKVNLRPLSSTHLRNRAILDCVKAGKDDKKVMECFGITFSYHLKRFKKYLSTNLPS